MDFAAMLKDTVLMEHRAHQAVWRNAKLDVFRQLSGRLKPVEALKDYDDHTLKLEVALRILENITTWAQQEVLTLEQHDHTRPT